MSEVTLHIGGRAYTISCADGEEAQLARLGSLVDDKLRSMQGKRAPNETQNMLFAALLIADELQEARDAAGGDPSELGSRLADLEKQLDQAGHAQREAALELEAVRAERDTIANDLANIKSAASGQEPLFANADDLAPRLDQLATLVEKCADMLEGMVPAT